MRTKLNLVRIILLLLIMSCTFTTFAAKKDTTYSNTTKVVDGSIDGIKTVYSDLKSTAPKITEAIEVVAKELKVGVNKVWEILVSQQRVWSIAYLMLTIGSLGSWYMFYKRNFVKLKEGDYKVEYITPKIKNPDFDVWFEGRSGYEGDNRAKRYISDSNSPHHVPVAMPLTTDKMPWFKYVHLAICLVLSFFSYWHFSDMLTGFINPEYGAMKTILNFAQSVQQ